MQAITDLIVTLTYWAFGFLLLTLVLALVFGGKPSRKGRNRYKRRQVKTSPLEQLILSLVRKLKGEPDSTEETQPSYESTGRLLTPAERSFYGVLLSVVPDDVTVMCKVRMADLVKPSRAEIDQRTAFRKVSQKHIDFVLVRSSDLSIAAAIELNDASHQKANRQQRDQFVAHVFATACIPLLFYPACRTYLPEHVRSKVQQVMMVSKSESIQTEIGFSKA